MASTEPVNLSMFFPDVSTKPPLPELAPPTTLITPEKSVVSSAHTITLPPSPFSNASAEEKSRQVRKLKRERKAQQIEKEKEFFKLQHKKGERMTEKNSTR